MDKKSDRNKIRINKIGRVHATWSKPEGAIVVAHAGAPYFGFSKRINSQILEKKSDSRNLILVNLLIKFWKLRYSFFRPCLLRQQMSR